MNHLALAAFALALALSTASPGPTIATLLARVIGRGTVGVGAFCVGLVIGDAIWLAGAMLGLALLAETAQPVFAALKWVGVAYLLFFAWQFWTAPAEAARDVAPPAGEGPRLAIAGIVLTLGNPKTMLFYTALTPAILDLTHATAADFGRLILVLVIVYGAVLATYVALAARARRLFRSAGAVKRMNRTCGVAMAGAATAIATR